MPTQSTWEFIDDEQGYLHWVGTHSSGFVINTYKSQPSDYMVLHRAQCPSINNDRGQRFTSGTYIEYVAAIDLGAAIELAVA